MTNYGNTFWEVVKPLAITNLVLNPSIETNTTGFTAVAGTAIARTADEQKFGVYSISVTTINASNDGVEFSNAAIDSSTQYTFSVFVKGQSGLDYKLRAVGDVSGTIDTGTAFTNNGNWERQELTFTTGGSDTTVDVQVLVDQSTAHTFYADGWQLEAQAAASTYCDGDQPGCVWNGSKHGSTSARDGQSREGGEIINLNSDYDVIVRQQGGAGMPPVRNIQTDIGLQDGGLFQRTLTDPRTLVLEGVITGSDVNGFHFNRQRLIDAIKPDAVSPTQPFLLRYTGVDNVTKQLRVHYDGGLEFNDVLAEQEFFSVRVVAFEPYWEEVGNGFGKLSAATALTYHNFLYYDGDGVWSSASFDADVNAVLFGQSPNLYVAGDFTNINGDAFSHIAQFDGTTFTALATTFNNNIEALTAIGASLYAAGTFTTINGSTGFNRIAKFDGTDWTKLGDGLNGTAFALAHGRNGVIYVGGQFSAADGSLVTGGMAQWDGSSWSLVGTASTGVNVQAIAVDNDENVYAGGLGASFGAVTASHVAKFDGTNWANLTGGSVDGAVYALDVGIDGTLFVGGCIVNVAGGDLTVNGIALHDGNSWQTLTDGATGSVGGGTGGCVLALKVNDDTGRLHAGGDFLKMGGKNATTNFAQWNNSSWRPELIDIKNPTTSSGGPKVLSIDLDELTGRMAIGLSGSAAIFKPVVSTITNNGTAISYPTIDMSVAGSLFDIVNLTTDTNIHVDNYFVQSGETATIDLNVDKKTFTSDINGNIIDTIIPESNFANWRLGPGDNKITFRQINGNSAASAAVTYINRHWSIDGGAS